MKEAGKSAPAPRMDLFYIFFVFLLCSFIGWCFETIGAAISKHEFTERGYLFVLEPLPVYFPSLENVPLLKSLPLILGLPLIEIYGLGALISVFGFKKLANHPVWLFLTGALALTVFELLGSYFCSYVLHRTFWDYSGRFLNFQGRICLMSALAWGAGAVIAVRGVTPVCNKLYGNVKHRRRFRIIVSALMICALICCLAKYWWFPDVLAPNQA